MLVVIGRTGLAKVLEHPGSLFTSFYVRLGFDTDEIAQCSEPIIRPSPSAKEYGGVEIGIVRRDALNVCMYCAIHRSPERLACFYATIKQPAPR